MTREEEVTWKLERVRAALSASGAAAALFRGTDWFAWLTAGGSHIVLLTAETGVAEVFVTSSDAWVITDEIEARRLRDEELPADLPLQVFPWADRRAREDFIRRHSDGGRLISDRPAGLEMALPSLLIAQKRRMLASELERYREVGRLAGEAMLEVLSRARPDWTERQLAGAGAEALWARGLEPALTLVAGERRLPLYRHATAKVDPLGQEAMLVFCARGHGLFANLTRFVSFQPLPPEKAALHATLRELEAVALDHCRPGTSLGEVYRTLEEGYLRAGYPNAIREHHQGGPTGYLARETIATPGSGDILVDHMAVAWNPSLPGAKLEDTFVLCGDGMLENLTLTSGWPAIEVGGRLRPLPLERP